MPRREGRPLKLTPEVIEDVRRLLPQAHYLETVCAALDIRSESYRRWLKLGRQACDQIAKAIGEGRDPNQELDGERALYVEFYAVVKKALAEGEIRAINLIGKAAEDQKDEDGKIVRAGQWQAAAWILERRHPERWGSERREIRELQRELRDLKELVDRVQNRASAPSENSGDHSTSG